ncbi:MAG TPA: YceI family protein [Candidatus Deferrimicrobium sp.]|nr:YceI family protein [Candidatus Deferrimicrobium sp.]
MTATATATANPTTLPQIDGYTAGHWVIDPVHSDLSFTARHLMVSKVRGHFRDFDGEVVLAENPLESTVNANIRVASIDTNNEGRDNHVRSGDFFDVENHPTATYRSTGVRLEDGDFIVDGELSLRGVTRSVPLTVEINGFGADPMAQGGSRSGFTARGRINRKDFDINFAGVMNGVTVLGDNIDLTLEIEASLAAAA